MFSFNSTKEGEDDAKNPMTMTINTIQSCYSREKMLTLNKSPICFLRPALFHTVVRDLPELVRLAPSPDGSLLLTTSKSSSSSSSHT